MAISRNMIEALFPDTAGSSTVKAFSGVHTNSREKAEGSLFVPLIGERFDAHAFIDEAIKNGAAGALWDKQHPIPETKADVVFYLVDDTLKALQRLAHAYRNEINPTVIGITGSNGKTTTKDLVNAVLSSQYRVFATKGNLNNHIGVPLTILSMDNDCEMLVLEMGMSNFGEIELLSKIAEPDYAIITNIGESHIEYLGSRAGIATAKSEIVKGLRQGGTVIIDGDEPLLEELKHQYGEQVVSCGFESENKQIIQIVGEQDGQTRFKLDGEEYTLSLLGAHNVRNAAYAIVLANELDMDTDGVKEALKHPAMTGMRMEQLDGKNGSTIINDAYNASPTSMKAAIETVVSLLDYKHKIVVLGDMYEIGEQSKAFHRSVAEAVTEKIDYVFTIGEDASEISDAVKQSGIKTETEHFTDKAALAERVLSLLTSETVVLLKASRGVKLESILDTIGNMDKN